MIVNGNLEVIVSKDDFSNLNDGKDFIIGNNADYAILEDKKGKNSNIKYYLTTISKVTSLTKIVYV
nr:hypothetical protein [Methanobrevibacter oralis]